MIPPSQFGNLAVTGISAGDFRTYVYLEDGSIYKGTKQFSKYSNGYGSPVVKAATFSSDFTGGGKITNLF